MAHVFQNLVTFAIVAIFVVICVLASMKNPCYVCDFCGHFGVPFGFFFSKVVNLVISVILEIFVRGVLASRPCYLCDFCGQYLRTFRGLSWLLLLQNLVTFAILLAIFVMCVLASRENPCYFCDISAILAPLLASSFPKS